MFEGKDVTVILANAGSGKTTYIINDIAKELEIRRPEEVAFVTFTKKGAEEGLRRMCDKFMYDPDDLPYFRTIHSLSFKALNLKATQMYGRLDQRKFNKEYGYNVNRCEVGTGKVSPTKDSLYLDFYDLVRSGALTSKQLVEADIELGYYHQIVKDYEEYKAKNELVDFFDCLIKYVQQGEPLPCKTVYVDECFSPETKVRMADMSIKAIKDIKVGDYVMGTHGATKVINVCKGKDTMYNVMQGKNKVLFSCNSKHLIKDKKGIWTNCENIKQSAIVEQLRVTGEHKDLKIDPYFFGLWLGNGLSRECAVICNDKDTETITWLQKYAATMQDTVKLRKRKGVYQVEYSNKDNVVRMKSNIRKALEHYGFMLSKTKDNLNREYKEKRIPFDFLSADVNQRLQLLAGIIDSDGMYVKAGKSKKYRIEMARKELMQDIFNLVGSLGYNPTWYTTYHTTNGVRREYYRIDFYGSADLPCLLLRKQFTKGYDSSVCRIKVSDNKDYCGITVDAEDNLFVLENGSVVHNCQDITALQWQVIERAFSKAEKVVICGDDKQSIFSYSNARPDILIQLSKQYKVKHLSKSYRIPYTVYQLSNALTNFIHEKTEQEFVFNEANGEGSITQLNDIDRLKNFIDIESLQNKNTTEWFILARNNCFLDRPKKMLEDNLIPYWTADGFFMGGEIMKRIKEYENFKLAGYKNEAKREDFQRRFGIEDFNQPFTETNLFTEDRKYVYAAYIEHYGLDTLKSMCSWNPQILVSTIHHVKGSEAKNVAIMLDATKKTKANVFNNVDEELRILYVGITRTKENLFLIDSQNGEGFDNIFQVLREENGLEW